MKSVPKAAAGGDGLSDEQRRELLATKHSFYSALINGAYPASREAAPKKPRREACCPMGKHRIHATHYDWETDARKLQRRVRDSGNLTKLAKEFQITADTARRWLNVLAVKDAS